MSAAEHCPDASKHDLTTDCTVEACKQRHCESVSLQGSDVVAFARQELAQGGKASEA